MLTFRMAIATKKMISLTKTKISLIEMSKIHSLTTSPKMKTRTISSVSERSTPKIMRRPQGIHHLHLCRCKMSQGLN